MVAWLNSIDGSRHLFWFSACWGVVDMLFTRVFVIGPVLPRRVGVGCFLNLVIFGILCQFSITVLLVWWCWVVCFWLGFGLFTALFLAETFVESLILAQDERWRRA